jgi:hypothetical protein
MSTDLTFLVEAFSEDFSVPGTSEPYFPLEPDTDLVELYGWK